MYGDIVVSQNPGTWMAPGCLFPQKNKNIRLTPPHIVNLHMEYPRKIRGIPEYPSLRMVENGLYGFV